MQFTPISIATLVAIASSLCSADSASFGIMNTRSGSQFHFTQWGSNSAGNVIIGGTTFEDLKVTDDSKVSSDGQYFVVNDDYSISLGSESAAATGFSIGAQEGALMPFNLNGENGFVVCPNDAGEYILYTQNPANYSDACSGLASWAVYTASSSSSSSPAAVSSSSIATTAAPSGYQNSTTVTESDLSSTLVTVTSCSENACQTSSVPPVETLVGGANGAMAVSSITAFGALAFALLF